MPPRRLTSHRDEDFLKHFQALPASVKRQARVAYRHFMRDPDYPGLQFKRLHTRRPAYSVRINDNYRAIGLREGDVIHWFWIGTHADYDRLLKQL